VLLERVGVVPEAWDQPQIQVAPRPELQELRNVPDTMVALEDREALLVLSWESAFKQMAESLDPVPMAARVLRLLEAK
jgi:hypothetical protein